eukprot:6185239-Pleurochrysis_carterae.AAC.1
MSFAGVARAGRGLQQVKDERHLPSTHFAGKAVVSVLQPARMDRAWTCKQDAVSKLRRVVILHPKRTKSTSRRSGSAHYSNAVDTPLVSSNATATALRSAPLAVVRPGWMICVAMRREGARCMEPRCGYDDFCSYLRIILGNSQMRVVLRYGM